MAETLPEPPKPLPATVANLPESKQIKITRIVGRDLAAKDRGGTSDPFLRIGIVKSIEEAKGHKLDKKVEGFIAETPTAKAGLSFDMDLTGCDALNTYKKTDTVLKVEVWDENKVLKSEWMGCVFFTPKHLFGPYDHTQVSEWSTRRIHYNTDQSVTLNIEGGGIKGDVKGAVTLHFEIDAEAVNFVSAQANLESEHRKWEANVKKADEDRKALEAKEKLEAERLRSQQAVTQALHTVTEGLEKGTVASEADLNVALQKVFDENWFTNAKTVANKPGRWPEIAPELPAWPVTEFHTEVTTAIWDWIGRAKPFGPLSIGCEYLLLLFKVFSTLYLEHSLPFKQAGLKLTPPEQLDYLLEWVERVEAEKPEHKDFVIGVFSAFAGVVSTEKVKTWNLAHQFFPQEIVLVEQWRERGHQRSFNTKIAYENIGYGDNKSQEWQNIYDRLKAFPPENDIAAIGDVICAHLGAFAPAHVGLLKELLSFCLFHTTTGYQGGVRSENYAAVFRFFVKLLEGRDDDKNAGCRASVDPLMKDNDLGWELYRRMGSVHISNVPHKSTEGNKLNMAFRPKGTGIAKWPKEDGCWVNHSDFGYGSYAWLK